MILEIQDARPGAARTRLRLNADALPLTLGRALANDVILDDPYVDARHAKLDVDADGAIVLEDLGSVNGLLPQGTNGRGPHANGGAARIHVRPGTIVRIGRTTLRFRDLDEPVPDALADPKAGGPRTRRWLAHPGVRSAALVAACVVLAADTWLESYELSNAENALTTLMGFLMFGIVWAGGWSIAGRIVTHAFRFGDHLLVGLAGAATFTLVAVGTSWVHFFLPDALLTEHLATLVMLALFSALVAAHLGLASTLPARRCWRAGIVLSGAILAGFGAFALVQNETFSDMPAFSAVVKPVGARWVPTRSIDRFIEDAGSLRGEVDALADP